MRGETRKPAPAAPSTSGGIFAAVLGGLAIVGTALLVGAGRGGVVKHQHDCSGCGHSWQHDDRSFGDVTSHTCPFCGSQQWRKNVCTW